MYETTGRIGILSLCIFGKPYKHGLLILHLKT
jgi:hypothetical protein